MRTTILSMTTAIALAIPAVAQTDIEDTVRTVLDQQGYPEGTVDMLSEGQIAELYITATSSDETELRRVVDSYDLGEGDMTAVDAGPSGVEQTVADVLVANGYSGDVINTLSSGDIANIYAAETSGDESDVMQAIESAVATSNRTATDDPSAAEERAMRYLARQGVPMEQIEAMNQAELLSIYVALTSGDAADIDTAVSSALES
ncbi:MAG: hypothetical protein ACOCYW_07385 [Roseicyclus sp.]